MKKILCLAAGLLALASMPAAAADDYVATSGGVSRTFRAKDVSGKLLPMSIPSDATGVPYGTGNGLYVRQDGTWTFSATANMTGQYQASPPTLSNGATSQLQLDASGNLRVSGSFSASTAGAVTTASPSYSNGTSQALSLTTAGGLRVDGSATIQPMSATALPLPTGAATAAAQSTLQTTAASIDTKTPALVNGAVPADTVVRSTSVNRGGTLTTANTAVTLVPSNANRRGLAIQNRNAPGSSYSATTSVFMNCLATATADFNSLEIPAGALYETPAHHSGTGACSFISATASTPVYVREF